MRALFRGDKPGFTGESVRGYGTWIFTGAESRKSERSHNQALFDYGFFSGEIDRYFFIHYNKNEKTIKNRKEDEVS